MGTKKSTQLKRTIKYLASCKSPEIISIIISKSHDKVIKSICDAALNTARGNVALKKKDKKVLSANRKFIEQLIQKGEPPTKKRSLLLQAGPRTLGIVIPTILEAVLTSLGSDLFSK
jgi:hypothetical protein